MLAGCPMMISFGVFGSFGNEPMAIMLCPSSVIVVISIGISVQALPVTGFAAMPLVYAHEILCDVYFLNGGHFSKFLYLALLST